ncbi:MAG: molybdopterin-dependent oxidoreductase [Desulfobacterales bacterium]|nr:molybdopterin-dependent oxidoreductase [Desulfobacterales bacterium]
MDFYVNGDTVSANVPGKLSLLRFLRDHLNLTGTKNGCSEGQCGACMVLVDGRPARSCLTKMGTLAGKKVQTIEGVASDGAPHPFQKALVDRGAIQCGFCIPGMVISGVALLESNADPSDDQIKEALHLNLCRCGGYLKIIEAVREAARVLAGSKQPAPEPVYTGRLVGVSLPDMEAYEKVRGELTYADDIVMQGMLYGKVLWAQYPHAKILSVDTSQAEPMPGVACVLTAKDVPGRNSFGVFVPNHVVLCGEKVRYLGDAVAVVFAESVPQAEAAVAAIQVGYEQLEVVDSPQRALEEDSPKLHPQGNICRYVLRHVGDLEKGFSQADAVVEGHFTTPFVEHAYIEPEAGVAVPSPDGRVTVYSPTQFPFENRALVAASLGVPEEKVRMICTPIGGGFGGKVNITTQIWIAIGAMRTGRPCKITLTRPESLRMSDKRHAYYTHYRVGARKDGTITAVDARLLSDAGPYMTTSPMVLDQACTFSCGPYVIPNARIEGWAMYTNNANGGAFRGFGINQAAFSMESCLDMLGERLGLDPFELRLKNALDVGKETVTGETLRASAPMKQVLREAKAALDRMPPFKSGKKIGIGVAAGYKNVGAGKGALDNANANIELTRDGDVLVRVSTVDMGQGNRTAMAQIAADTIGVSYNAVKVITGDTDATRRAMGGVGERQTFCGGNAVLGAAGQFREKILAYVGKQYNQDPGKLELSGGRVKEGGKVLVNLKDLARFTAGEGEAISSDFDYLAPKTYPFSEEGLVKDPSAVRGWWDGDKSRDKPEDYRNYPSYAYTAHVAVVEVDTATGRVKVLKIIAAHDVGVALNPSKIEGQLEGSCLQGLGYALTEEYRVKAGMHLTRSLGQCRIPTIKDVPEIECIVVEDPEPNGPLGAKGISEVATVPVTPAIINAIYNAVGVRITDLPASRERVLAALNKIR